MEIISYVLAGELAHRDSMGTESIIRTGDVQRMSAGTGVTHSELNPSPSQPVHFLQIWIRPDRRGMQPSYEQKSFDPVEKRGKLRLVVSGDGAAGSLRVHQDVRMYAGLFDDTETAKLTVVANRRIYVHLIRGELWVQGTQLHSGDALKLTDVTQLDIRGGKDAEVLVFDLPGDSH
jgi:quercetin 2,3-dioxygenase